MEKIKVAIPPGFIPEKEYIIGVLLRSFLGIEFTLEVSNIPNYILTLPNGKQLFLLDAFFKNFVEDDGYLHEKNIPDKVTYTETKFSSEKNVPIIFGDQNLNTDKNNITCGIDIIASSFFMLSRWEEYAIKEKNENGNFPSGLSFLQKNKISYRPLVNEYVELLWNMMLYLGYSGKRKERKYKLKITHDIDQIARYDTFGKYVRALAGDLVLRKKPGLILKTTTDYFQIQRSKIKDPFDTFDFLMDISEKNGLKSHFYFIPAFPGETDFRYDINDSKVGQAILKIIKRDHIVGIHPSFSTFKNKKQLEIEIGRLKKHHSLIQEGRQHYLKFSNPETWQHWDDEGLKRDSTIGYENDMGFRAGVCYPYPVFNILTRKKLKLIEEPLIVMEGALLCTHPDLREFKTAIEGIAKTIKKYNGNFVFLWHNNNLNSYEWKKYGTHYENIIESIK